MYWINTWSSRHKLDNIPVFAIIELADTVLQIWLSRRKEYKMTFLQNGKKVKNGVLSQEWHMGEYVRLSKEDGDKPESDSIQNQQRIISKHI